MKSSIPKHIRDIVPEPGKTCYRVSLSTFSDYIYATSRSLAKREFYHIYGFNMNDKRIRTSRVRDQDRVILDGNEHTREYHAWRYQRDLDTKMWKSTEEACPDTRVVIWSGEHGAYWGPKRCGYTSDIQRAGVYTISESISASFSGSPEKKIQLIKVEGSPFYFTCGQSHVNKFPHDGTIWDKDGIVCVYAQNEFYARGLIFSLFGGNWCMVYQSLLDLEVGLFPKDVVKTIALGTIKDNVNEKR